MVGLFLIMAFAPLRLVGSWNVLSEEPRVGGISALAVDGQSLVGRTIDVLIADPFIYREEDTYYLYGTASRSGLLVWTSDDLVDWRLRGHAFERSRETWSRQHFWAPELFKHNDKYYLHFTAQGRAPGEEKLDRQIVLAEGDSPLGPFREIRAPWFKDPMETIDSHVFKDEDGKIVAQFFAGHIQVRLNRLKLIYILCSVIVPLDPKMAPVKLAAQVPITLYQLSQK